MSRNKFNKPFILILILILLVIGFLFCIQPVRKFSTSEANSTSFKEILKREMIDSIVDKMFSGEKDFQFDLSEQDINDIISGNADKLKNRKIDGLHCVINGSNAIFYADLKLFSSIQTQVILKTDINVTDNKVNINIDKAYIGRLPVLKSFILKMVNEKLEKVDTTNSGITVPVSLPESITINDFEVSDSIRFKLKVSIKSVNDLLEILKYFGSAK